MASCGRATLQQRLGVDAAARSFRRFVARGVNTLLDTLFD